MTQILDNSQKQFCQADPNKNIRLLAPAGCGKTISILYRCLHIAKAQKTKNQNFRFLIFTFTRAARDELSFRLHDEQDFASIRNNVDIVTLNSWGYRRIKNIAFSPRLITDNRDYHFTMRNQLQPIWMKHEKIKSAIEGRKGNHTSKKIMSLLDLFKSIGFDHTRQTNYEKFQNRLTELRLQGLDHKIEEVFNDLAQLNILNTTINRQGDELAQKSEKQMYNNFFRFWREATQHLIESATFTLEDQKYVAYISEQEKLNQGKYLSGAARYQYILVDEFQDINPLDLALLNVITKRNKAKITIVGDDDQALFEWRGATPKYILDPESFFGVAFSTYTLNTNYRSPRNIVTHSQKLIKNNSKRVKKTINPNQNKDALIQLKINHNLAETMKNVESEVQEILKIGNHSHRLAIIGRKRSQLIPYQILFASKNIPFCAAEDLQIFMSSAFERLIKLIDIKDKCNIRRRKGEVIDDLLELCNLVKRYPLSKKDKQLLRSYLKDSQLVFSTLLKSIPFLKKYRGSLKGKNDNGKMSLDMAHAIENFLNADNVSDSISELGENFTGLHIDLGKAEEDIFYTDPPFLHLSEYATRYKDDYSQFIEDVDRAKDELASIPPIEDDSQTSPSQKLLRRPVHLMTAIRAKGKEFDSVILLDVNERIWPNHNADTPEQLEAERRVFYVAFTRAKKQVLMFARKRIGNKEISLSRFLKEMGL